MITHASNTSESHRNFIPTIFPRYKRFLHAIIAEVIPSNSAFAENYLQQAIKQENIVAHYQAIQLGIADADAGKLISLATVKAKWLSR